jgi:hypothetical protein
MEPRKVRMQFEVSEEDDAAIRKLMELTGHTSLAELMRTALGWYGDTFFLVRKLGFPSFPQIGPWGVLALGIFPGLKSRWDALEKMLATLAPPEGERQNQSHD